MAGVGVVGDARIGAARVAVVAHVGEEGVGVDEFAAGQVFTCADALAFQPFRVAVEEGAVDALLMPVTRDLHAPIDG